MLFLFLVVLEFKLQEFFPLMNDCAQTSFSIMSLPGTINMSALQLGATSEYPATHLHVIE